MNKSITFKSNSLKKSLENILPKTIISFNLISFCLKKQQTHKMICITPSLL